MYHHIIEQNAFLNRDVNGFYYCDYTNMRERGESYFLNELKNDDCSISTVALNNAANKLLDILSEQLPVVLNTMKWENATICVVPRAKAKQTYDSNQLLFSRVVSYAAEHLPNFEDGTAYITRHTHTRTTHRANWDNVGNMPYIGITKDTCNISDDVIGKNIILIDDIYTKTINIDEDVIQALLDKGANAVCLYTVARTPKKY